MLLTVLFLVLSIFTGQNRNVVSGDVDLDANALPKVEENIGKVKEGSKTDDETVKREAEAIKLEGINVAQMQELREKSKKEKFQAQVDRMMKLIINSLYKNKEIYLRELISNAADALERVRSLSLTDPTQLESTEELSVRIKADKENHMLCITDTGIGMTKDELVTNLGTIAKSGTSEFLQKMETGENLTEEQKVHKQDLIGQFGVGFYSSFLVANEVAVTSKSNSDPAQHIWESDATTFNVFEDPRGNTLKRGTQICLKLKEEAHDFLEASTLKSLIKKYSQFINFPIYMWTSKTETVEEPIEDEPEEAANKKDETKEKKDDMVEDEEAKVEEEKEESAKKPKTKKVEKTTWDWELINDTKPLWTRKPSEVKEEEYNEFYKSITKDYGNPLCYSHFTAEGEVTFKSLLFVPTSNSQSFNDYGKKHDNLKLYVRRVFITEDLPDMMPNYLNFIRGLIDSDDLPLNVSRETLQQNKLLKVIKKKLVRKVLDMLKKLDKETFEKFWKEYSTNIKLGVIEDSSNRSRLAKLLRFRSSESGEKFTSLTEYVERMKDKQDSIYFMAGDSMEQVKKSPFVERLLEKKYEILYLTDPVDEYTIQAMPDFEGKKLRNVAKEGDLALDKKTDKAKERAEQLDKDFKPLTEWLKENALKDSIEKAVVSQRLAKSPCAVVANSFGWSGNMERLMRSQAYAKTQDPMSDFYGNQKKIFEINPRHPILKELLERVKTDKDDKTAHQTAQLLWETCTVHSGYMLKDTAGFAERVESLLKSTLNISPDEVPEEEPEEEVEEPTPTETDEKKAEDEIEDSTEETTKAAEDEAKDKRETEHVEL